MTDDGSAQSTDIWPMPKFYFEVKWDSTIVGFQEVGGLNIENEPIQYRSGDNPVFLKAKMPGLMKSGNVVMKKGVLASDHALWDWFGEVKMNTIKRKPVTISLLDESGAPTMVWTLTNAFPIKISSTDLQAEGNEVAVETIEFAHEGVTIASR